MTETQRRVFDVIYARYPQAECELTYQTKEQLAIAIILSAQTTDKLVNTVTPVLFSRFPSMSDLAQADIHEIESCIQRIGLYRNKARNIKDFAISLVNDYNGLLPSDHNALIQLAGVGQKTANVIQAVAFNIPALAVDTHVHRVALRLGLVTKNASVQRTEEKLKKILPENEWIIAHHRMLFFGRYHCMAKNPQCLTCELKDICRYYKQKK